MSELKDWSTTAASNNSAPPNGWPENMNYSAVNDTGREVMAVVARYDRDTRGDLTAGGTANALTLTPAGTYTAYFAGMQFGFTAAITNTGAATLNVSALGAKSIVTADGSALSSGQLIAGRVYKCVYDGTQFQLLAPVKVQTLALDGTTAVDLINSTAVLRVAPGTGQHLEMDGNGIQSKSNDTTASNLVLNRLGGSVVLYEGGAKAVETEAGGVGVYDDSGSAPILRLRDDLGALRASIGYTAANANLIVDSEVASGAVILRVNNGTQENVLNGAPGGSVQLYYAGAATLATTTSGIRVKSPTTDNQARILLINQSDSAQRGLIGYNTGNVLTVRNDMPGAGTRLDALDAVGTTYNDMFIGDPDGAVTLYYAGGIRFQTTSTGVSVSNGSASALLTIKAATTGEGVTEGGQINMEGAGTDTYVALDNYFGDLRLLVNNGSEKAVQCISNGAVELFHNNTKKFETTSNGALVSGTLLDINTASAASAILQARNTTMGMNFTISTTDVRFHQTNAAGTVEDIWMRVVRNAEVDLRYNNTSALRTQGSGASGSASGAEVTDPGGVFRDVGFNVLPINAQTGTAYTVAQSDCGKLITMNNAAANTVTLPNNAAIPAGATVNISQEGAGATSVATAAGVTMKFGPDGTSGVAKTVTLNFRYSNVVAIKESDTVWRVDGGAA